MLRFVRSVILPTEPPQISTLFLIAYPSPLSLYVPSNTCKRRSSIAALCFCAYVCLLYTSFWLEILYSLYLRFFMYILIHTCVYMYMCICIYIFTYTNQFRYRISSNIFIIFHSFIHPNYLLVSNAINGQ